MIVKGLSNNTNPKALKQSTTKTASASFGVTFPAQQYWLLARFDKPIGILILLWPALWALWVASSGHPDILVLTVICGGVVLMRAAGCVINDYADRDFDPHVERTKLRPIASG
jgi:4-hydroxybenzoate polyprenyltransferase